MIVSVSFCKLQRENMSYILIGLKKFTLYCLKYSSLFIYLNQQIDLFMNKFALIFDFKQIQSGVYSRNIV